MEPENIDALVDRAEAYITNEEYDKGGYLCVFSACAGLFMYEGHVGMSEGRNPAN